jgi:hypothetical protein
MMLKASGCSIRATVDVKILLASGVGWGSLSKILDWRLGRVRSEIDRTLASDSVRLR